MQGTKIHEECTQGHTEGHTKTDGDLSLSLVDLCRVVCEADRVQVIGDLLDVIGVAPYRRILYKYHFTLQRGKVKM